MPKQPQIFDGLRKLFLTPKLASSEQEGALAICVSPLVCFSISFGHREAGVFHMERGDSHVFFVGPSGNGNWGLPLPDLALGQNQWYHFGVGAPPILEPIFVVGFGCSLGGNRILTHVHLNQREYWEVEGVQP